MKRHQFYLQPDFLTQEFRVYFEMNTLTEKLRRGIHSLESHTELRNYISEEEDVMKGKIITIRNITILLTFLALQNFVKQKDESMKFMGKYGMAEGTTEEKDLFQHLFDINTQHSVALTGTALCDSFSLLLEFTYKYSNYIKSLKDLLALYEKASSAEKAFQEVEARAVKAKASQTQVTEAKNARDIAAQELIKVKNGLVKESLRQLTQFWCEFYSTGLGIMNKQLTLLGGVVGQPTSTYTFQPPSQPFSSQPLPSQPQPPPSQSPYQTQPYAPVYQSSPVPQQPFPSSYPSVYAPSSQPTDTSSIAQQPVQSQPYAPQASASGPQQQPDVQFVLPLTIIDSRSK